MFAKEKLAAETRFTIPLSRGLNSLTFSSQS